jgi:hypothetical protein
MIDDKASAVAVQLSPPPRDVPFLVRCHLLVSMWTFMGSFFLGLGSIFALTLGLECDPLGSLRLALWGREASGTLKDVQETHYEENDERVYRFTYSFPLPDGRPQPGTSYWPGKSFDGPMRRAPAGAGMAITVEYDPVNPGISRIKGTRTGMCAHWVMFVFIFPTLGAAMLLGGLARGRKQMRLMKWGEAVEATLTVCHAHDGEGAIDVPVAEFKQQWHAQMRGAQQFMTRSMPVALALRGFVGFWTCGVLAFVIFDVLFCLAGITSLLFNFPIPLHAPPHIQLIGGGMILAFLIISLTMVSFMFHGMSPVKFRRLWSTAEDPSDASGWLALRRDIPNVDCAFEYRLPNGETARSRGTITLTGAPEENLRQAALIDPENSLRVMLVSSLLPSIWVGPTAEWETDVGLTELLRMAAVLILCVGGPMIGLTLHIIGL